MITVSHCVKILTWLLFCSTKCQVQKGMLILMLLYHGTSSNKARKIVTKGFRPGSDGAVFFAEDMETARYFASTVKLAPDEDPPKSFTIIIFDIPDEIIQNLFRKGIIGEFRDAPPIQISATSSPYEYILHDLNVIESFNCLLLNTKKINSKRWRVL